MTHVGLFSKIRFEREARHLYYLPSLLNDLELPRSTYVVGHRGTGKTTLLHALNWKERLDNPALRDQLGEDPLSSRSLGLYMKLPAEQLVTVGMWLSTAREDIAAVLTALYLDSLWLQLAGNAVAELLARGHFVVHPDREQEVVRDALSAFRDIPLLRADGAATVIRLRELCAGLQRDLERRARLEASPQEAANELVSGGIGALGRTLGKALIALCEDYRPDPDNNAGSTRADWHFTVCMDEGEALSRKQLVALNSMVRLGEHPVYFVVSFVGPPLEPTRTALPNLTLNEADVRRVNYDDLRDGDFRSLLEGVMNARLEASMAPFPLPITLDRLLGRTDLNVLLHEKLRRLPQAQGAGEIIDLARELQTASEAGRIDLRPSPGERSSDGDRRVAGEAPVLPIWQAYAAQRRLGGGWISAPNARRRLADANLSQYRVPAYFAIHRQLKIRPLYAGADVLVGLADNCIRDFLSQMDAIFAQIGGETDEVKELAAILSSGPLTPHVQSQGLKAAAQRKIDLILGGLFVAPDSGRQVVLGISELVAGLQRERDKAGSLDIGPGHVRLRRSGDAEAFRTASGLLRDAREGGYLKSIQGDDLTVRVHNSLAAYFELPWLKGYRAFELQPSQLQRLATAETDAERVERVKQVMSELTRATRRIGGAPEPLPLPGLDD